MNQIPADIALKRTQTAWEPWKAMTGVLSAAAAIFTGLGILIGYLLRGNVH